MLPFSPILTHLFNTTFSISLRPYVGTRFFCNINVVVGAGARHKTAFSVVVPAKVMAVDRQTPHRGNGLHTLFDTAGV